jgi:starvation-inducible outer membrane lipoprotein
MRKTLTVAVATLAIGLAGCARTPDNANTQKYPQEAKDNFADTCTSTALKARGGDQKTVRDNCKCVITKLEASLPYDSTKQGIHSFKDADMALKDGKPLPADINDKFDKATADCRK